MSSWRLRVDGREQSWTATLATAREAYVDQGHTQAEVALDATDHGVRSRVVTPLTATGGSVLARR